MLSIKTENIYDVARPLHLCSYILGLTTFSIKMGNGKFVPHTSYRDVSCFVVLSLCNLSVTAAYLVNFKYLFDESILDSEVYVMTMFAVVLFYVMVTFLINWWSFLSQKYLAAILNSLNEIDKVLDRIESPVNFIKHKKFIVFFVVSVNVFIAASIVMLYLNAKIEKGNYMVYYLVISTIVYLGINILTTFHYTFLMWAVKLRYQNVNLYLNKVFLMPLKNCTNDDNRRLTIAATLHEKLVDACEHINQCYGVPVGPVLTSFKTGIFNVIN